MTTQDIAEGVIFNALEIAQEIEDAESIQNSNESAYTKERARMTAYAHILDLIHGGEQE